MNSNQKSNIVTLCRIKVNKMLSSLNSANHNIFIPKYTLNKKTESNYISHLNINNNKPKQKIKINKKRPLINKNTDKNKPVDFIINHGVLVYQRNMKGEEIINYGINTNKFNKNENNDIVYSTESNFNKKKFKINSSRKTLNTTRTNNDNFNSNNNNIKLDNKNKIITKKRSCNYIKSKTYRNFLATEINPKKNNNGTYLLFLSKLKKIFNKRIKNIYLLLKYNFFENIEIKLDTKEIISHKKSNSIIVNRKLSSNFSNLISKNFKFFTKEKEEPELFRDSKSLEKKYEQICRRKKLNMSMTFSDKFREDNFLKENNNYLSEKNTYNSISNEINAVTDRTNSIIENINYKINLIENKDNKINDKNILSYRIEKNPLLKKKNTSYNFSYSDFNFKEESFSNNINNINLKKKISLYRNYFSRSKNENKSNSKMKKYLQKEKEKNKLKIIKNIITKDKRIFIRINYLSYIFHIKKNQNKKNNLLNIEKIFEFSFIPKNTIKKRINKRKSEIKNKLFLIKEEEEKNSSIKIKNKKNNVNVFNLSMIKLINILEKNIYLKKFEFFLKLNKLTKIQKKIHCEKHISNIIIKDKIFLNNIFINNDKRIFGSHSLDFDNEFRIIDSSALKNSK